MNWIKVGFAALMGTVLVSTALGSGSLLGIWHGKLHFDKSNLPLMKSPRKNSARMAALVRYEQANLTLTLKGDKTYRLLANGGPGHSTEVIGSWKIVGTSLLLQQMDHGRELGYPQVYTIDKSYRYFSVTKDQAGVKTTVSFSK